MTTGDVLIIGAGVAGVAIGFREVGYLVVYAAEAPEARFHAAIAAQNAYGRGSSR